MDYRLGIDIGSTTIKVVLLDENENIIYSEYRRHLSDVRGGLTVLFDEIGQAFPNIKANVSITGSAGLSVAKSLGIEFVQEVIAATQAVEQFIPQADVVIELGGEDAKITFMKPVLSQRMNGTCAGGTGAFIDQMASLLQTDASGLNELAKKHKTIYPMASRCGVFAKSDLQPLLNDGAPMEDLAASVLQAVVNQTVAGLACGQPITGNIVFLGGPLHFMSELRKRFEVTLEEGATSFYTPENGQLFVAMGAALVSKVGDVKLSELGNMMRNLPNTDAEIQRMGKLFETDEQKKAFYDRHEKASAKYAKIEEHKGPCFLGIDAGSTTIKAALTNENGDILYSYYNSNKGNPIKYAVKILKEIYALLPNDAYIANGCVTGYGEALLKTALCFDEGEVETLSHYKAADFFAPDVDYIIDIGGQDMKCIKIRNKIIDSVVLNEACSSGCGSFIQAFAKSLSLETHEFANAAIEAENPVDLGTRCTVFMNSRVKQAQKEGATPGDISAGLSYSVVRNALYKVVKLKSPDDLGNKVLVQGGTFLNDAILRCFELISGKEVIRPNIAGLMGAFGASRIAQERWDKSSKSQILSKESLEHDFVMTAKAANCKACSNNCKLTITTFDNGRKLITGNRCERGAGASEKNKNIPNLIDYKYKRLFAYKPLSEEDAPRGTIGLPRVLNMYEDYPFWFTMLTALGFRVIISKRSDHKLFEKGMSTIPSESVCYPAKLAHGHVIDLIEKGIDFIFYPCLPYSKKEDAQAGNHYNCPIVTSYPEVIWNNMEILKERNIKFKKPFLSKDNPVKLMERILKIFSEFNVTKTEVKTAVLAAYAEQKNFQNDMHHKGEEVLEYLEKTGKTGIVIAGRPYHADPEVNHGIPAMIASLDMPVLTEDSIAHLNSVERPLRVVDQWVYHTRLYNAAQVVVDHDNLELIQLNSFGCGLDAVTTDQVEEILQAGNKIYTCLKIDEISNLGAARIRARSLKVAIEERSRSTVKLDKQSYRQERILFTKEMRKKHTLIAPQMAPMQFELIEAAMNSGGYNIKVLKTATPADIETGLKYVNNDACYPTIIVIGQIIHALLSGEYDVHNTSILMTQTGGGCRATNYIAFLRKALKDAGLPQIPVVSVNASGLEKNPGFKFTPKLLNNVAKALVLGDLLQKVVLRVRPYELVKGSTNELYEKWNKICIDSLADNKIKYKDIINGIVNDFEGLMINENITKPKVGLVGEILVKFQPDANNNAIDVIETEGCEAVVPGLIDFFLYCFSNSRFKYEKLGKGYMSAVGNDLLVSVIEKYRKPASVALIKSKRFSPPESIYEIQKKASRVLSIGNTCGEGWLLTGEMIELIESGVPNIICTQPFACLPNHVTGKGMIKELRRQYPESNIVAIDYDPGASEVNQLNRIKLMISTAFKRMNANGKTTPIKVKVVKKDKSKV